jgi:hypothetical protein
MSQTCNGCKHLKTTIIQGMRIDGCTAKSGQLRTINLATSAMVITPDWCPLNGEKDVSVRSLEYPSANR